MNGLYVQINYINGTTESLSFTNPRTNRGDSYYYYDVSHINSQPTPGYSAMVLISSMGGIGTIYVSNRQITIQESTGFYYGGPTLILIGLQPW